MTYNREVSYNSDALLLEFYIDLFEKAHLNSKTLGLLQKLDIMLMNGPSPEYYKSNSGRHEDDIELQKEIQTVVKNVMATFDEEFPGVDSKRVLAGLVI